MKIYRHGDLMVTPTKEVPKEAKKQKGTALLDGEVTGHTHRLQVAVAEKEVGVYELNGVKYFTLTEMTPLVHEEHKTIELPPGVYKTSRLREYDPYEKAARDVQD